MACLEITITPVESGVLAVSPVEPAELTVEPVQPAELSVRPAEAMSLAVFPIEQAQLGVNPIEPPSLEISEVCTIGGGTLVVLAATDGPLRTKNGGYILLDPATNPPEE